MKKLSLFVLAALALLLGSQAAQAQAPQKVLSRAIQIIGVQESNHNYGLVMVDTNGKISAGFLQWNAQRAVNLVKEVLRRDGTDDSWDGTLTSSNKAWASKLLATETGRAVQDELARRDVSGYIEKAMALSIRDHNALCYYADIAHQVGSGAIVKYHKLAAEKAGSYEKVTLEHLYQAALTYATHTEARRTRVYKLLKDDPIGAETQPDNPPDEEEQPTAVALTPKGPLTLSMGKALTLTARLKPAGAASALAWTSDDEGVATVANGVVTPVKPGRARITVKTGNGLKASVLVTVKGVAVKSVALSGDARMKKGETQTLRTEILPAAAANRALAFKSGNRRVAKVSQQGVVTAVNKGACTIYAKSKNGRIGKFKLVVE